MCHLFYTQACEIKKNGEVFFFSLLLEKEIQEWRTKASLNMLSVE
jgi:hypothetical protein